MSVLLAFGITLGSGLALAFLWMGASSIRSAHHASDARH